MIDRDFLLKTYGQCYDPEAGPWNLSVENKYLEYMFASFFEENFALSGTEKICNIGIGAGYWDRYLSYKLHGGSLTSVDIDPVACRQLTQGLENENNPNSVEIICSDVTKLNGLDASFDLVTMVGTTRLETGKFEEVLGKVFSLIKKNGEMYYQSLDPAEDKEDVLQLFEKYNMRVERYLLDDKYGFKAQYWKITK